MAVPALLLGPLMDLGGKVFDRIFPDKTQAEAAKFELMKMTATHEFQQWADAANIVREEAKSSNWLTSGWRPLTMLTFVALIVARMFGLTADAVSEAEYMLLWDLVKLGLGGYVIGRSAEKVVPGIVGALKGKA